MGPGRVTLLLVAWSALMLPWERCHAACHDRVEMGEHECHTEEGCPAGEDGTTRHERISFDSLTRPADPLAALAPVVASPSPAPAETEGDVRTARDPLPAAPPRTTVLLL